ncbi:hypothetical protein N9772_00735 [Bacteroidia bacterium]|nr:hypothetical protein [Bacteroidia bacterium]
MNIKNRNREVPTLAILTIAVFSFISYVAYISPGISGGMDSYNHYLIARHSWSYPSLFLDQWGKPIYNLIASPFVQFGIPGAILLNMLSLLGCSVLVYKIIQKLNLRYAWLGYIFTLTSPIFLDNTISAITEPLCALLVILTLYLYIDKKYVASAVLAGLLPFARSEGFIILFAIAFFLIVVDKRYQTLAYAFVGSLVFNILGWAIEGEAFWVITSNPYINFELSGRNICGSGGLFHYFYAGHYTFGLIASLLAALGGIFYAIRSITKGWKTDMGIGLILLCFALYFGSHVGIWWFGKMGSCGYVRVMVVIAPLASILMVYGFNYLFKNNDTYIGARAKIVRQFTLLFLVINTFYVPYRYYSYKYPMQISAEQAEYLKLAVWYETHDFQARRKIYLYPYFSILADINPYDQKEHLDFWASSLQYTREGDILIWDGHFGPHESGTSLESLETDPSWNKIYSIVPAIPIITLNNKEFEIHVFEKIK